MWYVWSPYPDYCNLIHKQFMQLYILPNMNATMLYYLLLPNWYKRDLCRYVFQDATLISLCIFIALFFVLLSITPGETLQLQSLAIFHPTYTFCHLLSRHFGAGIIHFIHSLKLHFLPLSKEVRRSWKTNIIASLYLSTTTEPPYMCCICLMMTYWRIK